MLHPRRPVFLKSAWVKPQTGQRVVAAPFSISSAAPIPRSKSARAKPVGSCTPFSFEQASQRFTFCILPSRICVRKTVASLHLQTSQSMADQIRPQSGEKIQPLLRVASFAPSPTRVFSLRENPRPGLARQLAEARHRTRGNRARLAAADGASVDFDHRD